MFFKNRFCRAKKRKYCLPGEGIFAHGEHREHREYRERRGDGNPAISVGRRGF
jgi:hypothetical protein